MVHKKSKNLKNGHFLQSRTKIVLIKIKFANFSHIRGWCAPVCLINTLKNLVNEDLFLHHKPSFEAKTKNSCLDFYIPMYQCALVQFKKLYNRYDIDVQDLRTVIPLKSGAFLCYRSYSMPRLSAKPLRKRVWKLNPTVALSSKRSGVAQFKVNHFCQKHRYIFFL
jgi:hypothetical protein